MPPFSSFTAIAAPLPLANVDTDKILPARFLKTISRDGLGRWLFADLRYGPQGDEWPDFVLNREPWRRAGMLIARENFGCGSSREHAPWALTDFGIRVIIATSFAEIFYNNCFKNGLLPVQLPAAEIEAAMVAAIEPGSPTFVVDLQKQTVVYPDGRVVHFAVPPDRKRSLLEGLDEIDASLTQMASIVLWEQRSAIVAPPIPLAIADP